MSETVEDPNGPAVIEAGAEAAQAQDDGPSVEDRALAMGWTPQSQFKGDPEKWVDADTFVKRGEEFLPFLKANNRRLEKALETAKKDIANLAEFHSKTAEREYRRAYADIQARLDASAAAGDVEGVREATDDLVQLSRETDARPAKEGPNEEFVAWREDNEWYGKDKALSAAFDALCIEVAEEGYTKPKAGLKEAMGRLREAFPEKFAKPSNPNRSAPAAVEGAGGSSRRSGKSRADLPADARSFMDRMVKQGHMTEAQYLKDYFGQ